MRYLFSFCLIALLPSITLGQVTKKKDDSIQVVELNRKDAVIYEKEVEPIFYKKCITCHSGSVKEGRFDLSSHEGVMKGGKRGKAVEPGKGKDSLLYNLAGRFQKPHMPPKGETPMTPEELALVKLWIDQGAKAPTGERPRELITLSPPPATVTPVRAVALSPDKSAVAAGRGNVIHIYDAGSGAHIRTLIDPSLKLPDGKACESSHMSLIESIGFSNDGKYLVSGSFQEIAIWDLQTGMLREKVKGYAHNVVCVTFSPDGKLFATTGGAPTEDGEIKIFEVGTWKMVGDFKNAHSDTVYGACFSPDSKMIATASADKFVKVFEVPSGKFVKSFEGHTHHVLDVGWQNDGKLLASAGADNTVKVWEFEKGEQARTINAHTKQVTRLQFIGKTPQFVTCSGDTQVKIFNATNGGVVRTFAGGKDYIYAVSVSQDGNVVAAGGEEGVVRVYNGTSGALLKSLLPPGVVEPKN